VFLAVSSLAYWDVCLSSQIIIINLTHHVMRCYVMIVRIDRYWPCCIHSDTRAHLYL